MLKKAVVGGQVYVVDANHNPVAGPFPLQDGTTADQYIAANSGGQQQTQQQPQPTPQAGQQQQIGGTGAATNVNQQYVPPITTAGYQPGPGATAAFNFLNNMAQSYANVPPSQYPQAQAQQQAPGPAQGTPEWYISQLDPQVQAGIQNGSMVFYPPGDPRAPIDQYPNGRVVTAADAAFMDVQDKATAQNPNAQVTHTTRSPYLINVMTGQPESPPTTYTTAPPSKSGRQDRLVAQPAPFNPADWMAQQAGTQMQYNPNTGAYELSGNQIAANQGAANLSYEQQAAAKNAVGYNPAGVMFGVNPPGYAGGGTFMVHRPSMVVDMMTGQPVAKLAENAPETVTVNSGGYQAQAQPTDYMNYLNRIMQQPMGGPQRNPRPSPGSGRGRNQYR